MSRDLFYIWVECISQGTLQLILRTSSFPTSDLFTKFPPPPPCKNVSPSPYIYLLVTTCKGSSLLGRGKGSSHLLPPNTHPPSSLLLPPIVFWGPLIESQPLLPFTCLDLRKNTKQLTTWKSPPTTTLDGFPTTKVYKRDGHLAVDHAGSSTASPFVHRQFLVLPSQQLPDTITDLYTHEEVTVKCLCFDPLKYIVYVFLDSSGQIWCLC